MIRGCKARQYSDQMYCRKCDTCWDCGDEDPPLCRAVDVEYLVFYAPITLLAVAACWLMSPDLAVVVWVGLVLVSWWDAVKRGRR